MVDDADPRGDFSTDAEVAAAAVTTGLTCSAGRTDRSVNRPLPLFLTVEVMDSGVRGLG